MVPFSCNLCRGNTYQILFSKIGKDNLKYDIIKCKKCKVVQTFPQPKFIEHLYKKDYFQIRTHRGYDNYTSDKIKHELLRVWNLNLKDLHFYEIEKKIFQMNKNPKLLEIGSAAGFFLEYMKNRGWSTTGIEISPYMAQYAIKQFHLNIINSDFTKVEIDYKSNLLSLHSYDLIVLWATIEHFQNPLEVIKKVERLLKSGSYVIISTCRWGLIPKILKSKWRFMNVPEHLYFFTKNQLIDLFNKHNFKLISYKTYGSGFTTKNNMSLYYKIAKKICDKLVKILNQGDMMILLFQKI